MKNSIFIATLFLSLFSSASLFAHCPMDFKEVDLCAEITWLDGPNLNQKSQFQISFWEKGDASHTPVSPEQDVTIYSWMTMNSGSMSHGGPKMTSKEIEVGVFEVQDARFFMHGMDGFWEIKAELSDASGVLSTAASKVEFAIDSNHGHGHGHGHTH